MTCDWCGKHGRPTTEISIFGGSVLHICCDCFVEKQGLIFGDE